MEICKSNSQKNNGRLYWKCPNNSGKESPCNKSFAWVNTDKHGNITARPTTNYQNTKARANTFVAASTLIMPTQSQLTDQQIKDKFLELDDRINLYQQTIMDLEVAVNELKEELKTGYKDFIDVKAADNNGCCSATSKKRKITD